MKPRENDGYGINGNEKGYIYSEDDDFWNDFVDILVF